GLDRLEKEVDGGPRVDDEVVRKAGPPARGHEANELRSRREEEREHVERAHDHEGEAALAVGDLEELVPFVERVHERAVALASVERALGVLGELLLPLALLLRRRV